MLGTVALEKGSKLEVFNRETLIEGQPTQLRCVDIGGQIFAFSKGLLVTVGLEDDWYEDVRDPECAIDVFANTCQFKPDIFTFWQRVPDTRPKYQYHTEWESLAVLPIKTFDYWWDKQAKGTTRNMIRKSQKIGVEVREDTYDDNFVRGMTDIFNETPVRQGRRFWHYGKDFETVKRQFSRFLFRENLIGAYYKNELIGFAMLGNAGTYGILGQILSKVKHRDKAINNALIAKIVEICARKQLPYLVYAYWSTSSLVDFKRHSGFVKMELPRYFIPLTLKGRAALKLGLHRGWKTVLPRRIKNPLKKLRRFWLGLRAS